MLKGMQLILVIATLACVQAQKIDQEEIPSCQGVFDFYFVLDSSGSVGENFHSEVVPFVRNVSSYFVSPNFRLCFITFATDSILHMPLTRIGDSEAIEAGIQNLTRHSPGGNTNLAPGLNMVADQIETAGGDTAAVVLVLTDGEWQDVETSQEQSRNLRKNGARLFGIGVGDSVDEQQLLTIADEADQVFIDISFQQLDEVIEKVVNKTCIGIRDVNPNQICLGNTDSITLLGRGFTNDVNQSAVTCRFQIDNGQSLVTYPTKPVKYNQVVCPAPQLNRTGNVLLQISLNGASYISSNVTLALSSCEPEDKAYVAGIVLGLLVLLVLLLLLLLWFFFPLITGKIVGGLPPEQKTEDFESKPPKQWEVVDASYYGGGGVGGIKPMTVRWGASGATEEGNKLTRAKDATVLSVVRDAGTSQKKNPTPTCWKILKKKAKRTYAVLASYRPVRGPTRRIIWCANHDANYSVHSETSGTNMFRNHESSNNGKSKPSSSTLGLRKPPHSQPQEPPFQECVTHKATPSKPSRSVPPRPVPPRLVPPRPPQIEASNPLAQ